MACTPENEAESFVSLDTQINLRSNMKGNTNIARSTRLAVDRFASSVRVSSPDMFELSDDEEDDDPMQRNARLIKETDSNVDGTENLHMAWNVDKRQTVDRYSSVQVSSPDMFELSDDEEEEEQIQSNKEPIEDSKLDITGTESANMTYGFDDLDRETCSDMFGFTDEEMQSNNKPIGETVQSPNDEEYLNLIRNNSNGGSVTSLANSVRQISPDMFDYTVDKDASLNSSNKPVENLKFESHAEKCRNLTRNNAQFEPSSGILSLTDILKGSGMMEYKEDREKIHIAGNLVSEPMVDMCIDKYQGAHASNDDPCKGSSYVGLSGSIPTMFEDSFSDNEDEEMQNIDRLVADAMHALGKSETVERTYSTYCNGQTAFGIGDLDEYASMLED